MIIGLTGTLGAGKTTFVDVLKALGFGHYSVRGFLSEELERRGLPVTRKNMVNVANELRKKFGSGYIAEQLYERARKHGGDCVLESIRTLGEVDALKARDEFFLIGVDADRKERYKRIKERNSETDKISFEDFVAQEEREMHSDDPNKQNIRACMDRADYFFYTDYDRTEKSIEAFTTGKWSFIGLINDPRRRPSDGEVFMRQAYEWGQRSTCLRRRVGAVISLETIQISQGYNGAVRNARHCDEVGCIRQQRNIPSGQMAELCRGAHAEQNAVINAGRSGRSVIGATMYCTNFPCNFCAKDIVQSGIKLLLYWQAYNDELAETTLREGKVEAKPFSGVVPTSYSRFWD